MSSAALWVAPLANLFFLQQKGRTISSEQQYLYTTRTTDTLA